MTTSTIRLEASPVGNEPTARMKGRNGWTRAASVTVRANGAGGIYAAPSVRLDASSPRASWNPALALELSPEDARVVGQALLRAASMAETAR